MALFKVPDIVKKAVAGIGGAKGLDGERPATPLFDPIKAAPRGDLGEVIKQLPVNLAADKGGEQEPAMQKPAEPLFTVPPIAGPKGSEQAPTDQTPTRPLFDVQPLAPREDATQPASKVDFPVLEGRTPPVPQGYGNAPEKAAIMPQKSPLEQKRAELEAAVMAPAEKQKAWKQIAFQGLQALGNVVTGQNKPIEWLGNAKKAQQVGRLQGELAPLEQQYKNKQDRELMGARINDIPIDNELKRQEIDARKADQQSRLSAGALRNLNSLKWFDPQNAAHRRMAETAGINPDDLAGYDDRKPTIKEVAGKTYVFKDGKFEQSNLPDDESKTLTDYEVTMPTGEKRTYRVAQKDAASFTTQMAARGMEIKAAADRQKSSQEFTADQKERDRAHEEKMSTIKQNFERERDAYNQAQADMKNATSEAQKVEAQRRLDESRQKIINMQTEADKELMDYKKKQ